MKLAVIKTGGKQYLVKKDDEIIVDKLNVEKDGKIKFETLASFDVEKEEIAIGTPLLAEKVTGKIIDTLKGDKLRVARFKAKVRYRKVRGFRPQLSKVKIVSI